MHTLNTFKTVLALLALLYTGAATIPAATPVRAAAISRYDIRVDGLACPFCAYGLEKKLKALPGSRNVQVDLDGGRATFDVDSSTLTLPVQVYKAIRDAGFTPRTTTITAVGKVDGRDDELTLTLGEGLRLRLRGGSALDQVRALVRAGVRDLIVTGPLTDEDGAYRLAVAEVHQPGERK